jgi:hypothetical protein
MQQQRSNGRVRAVKDPDWRPTPEPAGYWPLPPGQELTVCGRCSAVIPATDRARQGHLRHHEQVDSHDPR